MKMQKKLLTFISRALSTAVSSGLKADGGTSADSRLSTKILKNRAFYNITFVDSFSISLIPASTLN